MMITLSLPSIEAANFQSIYQGTVRTESAPLQRILNLIQSAIFVDVVTKTFIDALHVAGNCYFVDLLWSSMIMS